MTVSISLWLISHEQGRLTFRESTILKLTGLKPELPPWKSHPSWKRDSHGKSLSLQFYQQTSSEALEESHPGSCYILCTKVHPDHYTALEVLQDHTVHSTGGVARPYCPYCCTNIWGDAHLRLTWLNLKFRRAKPTTLPIWPFHLNTALNQRS